MHVNATYYTQAWLFVHYLLIGRAAEGGPAQLAQFLGDLQSMSPADAFQSSFNMGYDEMESQLRSYGRQTTMNTLTSVIPEAAASEAVIRPASEELVELSLARLAFGTSNDDTLAGHLDRLTEIAPESPGAYDLMVAMKLTEDDEDIEALLDQAIAFGSRDARTYELKAAYRLDAAERSGPLFAPGALDAGEARRIANYLVSSANLRPINLPLYSALADVLFSVGETHDYDQIVLDNGAFLYPAEGVILLGQAALALAADDADEAIRLIELALSDPYELSARETIAARNLRSSLN
jgi:hypothetical protein